MVITKDKTVAQTVTENIKAAHVFKKYGIDFCCGGGISIEKVCVKKNIDFAILKNELLNINKASKAYDYDSWKLDFLIDHIINIHHTYVEQSIPLILQYAAKVAKVHGHHYADVEINKLFIQVANELTAHMKKEEIILFPYIKKLLGLKATGEEIVPPLFGTINNPISMMEQEHETAGNVFRAIAVLSNDYSPPEEACNTFRALYAKLQEFEQDLHQHIYLENNILFPKAVLLGQ